MLKRALWVFLVLFSVQSFAEEASKHKPVSGTNFVEGKQYQVLPTFLPTNAAVPVMEFMYYGCETCFKLAPAIAEWSYTKKIGVTLVPVHSESAMVDEARMFHTFQVAGMFSEMYEEGFAMFQSKETTLQGEERVNSFLAKHSMNKEKFWQAWNSDAVKQRLVKSAELTKLAQVTKTPTFVVHGAYKVDISSVKSIEELFLLLEYLTAKEVPAVPTLLKKPAE
jgi:protein dithiol oxidoreductase (disulfide-forming)